jgi:hypothetical protein
MMVMFIGRSRQIIKIEASSLIEEVSQLLDLMCDGTKSEPGSSIHFILSVPGPGISSAITTHSQFQSWLAVRITGSAHLRRLRC